MNYKASAMLLSLDAMWITKYMGKKYSEMIPRIQLDQMNVRILYAIFAYILMIVGLNVFVLPNIGKRKFHDSLKYGFLYGMILYGVYNGTAAAVFRKWDIRLATIDTLWGGLVFFLSAYYGK